MHLFALLYNRDRFTLTVVLVTTVLLAVATATTVFAVWRRVEIVTARLEVRLVAVMLTRWEWIRTATWKCLLLTLKRQ
jgi:hypothetical protein